MERFGKIGAIATIALTIVFSMLTVYADSTSTTIQNSEVVKKDKFVANRIVENYGSIKGDLFAGAQNMILNAGEIEGDLICAAGEINMSGSVLGNMRSAGGKVTISGNIGKNVNILSESVDVENYSKIGGNVIILASDVSLHGNIGGDTGITAKRVVLDGEYFGDVDINEDSSPAKNTSSGFGTLSLEALNFDNNDSKSNLNASKLTVLPGTIIHGKLTYKGITEANIQNGAKISEFQWVKPEIAPQETRPDTVTNFIWEVVRLIISTIIYFIIALILYRLMPCIFYKQGEIIGKKPLLVFGVGLMALVFILGLLIAFIVLVLLSIGIISPSVAVVFGAVAALSYTLLFYFSTVPVSLWLGDKLLRGDQSVPYRLATGLLVITVIRFILKLLAGISPSAFIFKFSSFIFAFTVVVMGMGALLYSMREIFIVVKRCEY